MKNPAQGTKDLIRHRPPASLLLTDTAGILLPNTETCPLDLAIRDALRQQGPRDKIIAIDLDETILARQVSCPRSWNSRKVLRELRFNRMIPNPKRLGDWLSGDRNQRDLYSNRLYPFLNTEPFPTQLRSGFTALLSGLADQNNTLVLLTASDRYRLNYLNRLLTFLPHFFESRQLALEDITSGTTGGQSSPYHKAPSLTESATGSPYDFLIDDSPKTRRFLESQGDENKFIGFDHDSPDHQVIATILIQLCKTDINLPSASAPAFAFNDPCYLAASPEAIMRALP